MRTKIRYLAVSVLLAATALAPNVSQEQAVHDRALVIHFEFEENGIDSRGDLTGDAKIVEDPERGKVLSLDGDGDYLDCGDEQAFYIDKQLTLACWVKFDAHATNIEALISKGGQNWMLARSGDTGHLYCNDTRPSEKIFGQTKLRDGQWYHLTGVYDGSQMSLYVNGSLDVAVKSSGQMNLDYDRRNSVWIGGDSGLDGPRHLSGFVDDAAIFNRALSAEEVEQLHGLGLSRFIAGPALSGFVDAVREAESSVREKKAQEVIGPLERKIAELDKWRQENPDAPVLYYKHPVSDLYFLLAGAKEAAQLPKREVAAAYKHAIEPERFSCLSTPRQGPALWWLHENTTAEDYQHAVTTLIQANHEYLPSVAEQAGRIVLNGKSKTAMEFLEAHLGLYSQWQQNHPYDEVIAEDNLPVAYFQLAKAKEAAGAPKKEIAEKYSKTFCHSRIDFVRERTDALTWLLENRRSHECGEAMQFFERPVAGESPPKSIVKRICSNCAARQDWPTFERFLDTLFTETKYPGEWSAVVESCVSNESEQWAAQYLGYLDNKPALKFGRDCAVAAQCMANQQYSEAARLYKSIVSRCGTDDDKGFFEFHLGKSSFHAGRYRDAVSPLEHAITYNKATRRALAQEAMLMLGRAYVQLSKLQKAQETFFTLLMVYADTKKLAEINFLLGYCYMMQGDFKAASEAFDCLMKSYPKSPFAEKARALIERIEGMT